MIAINDNYADGRDMSWLWDVDFESLKPGISHVSGVRAYDMALRLQYDEVEVRSVEPNLSKALRNFIRSNPGKPKRIYCSYTSMLALRRELAKITDVEVVT
jgi:UDP-N-acetylmuramyl tripeptide synthase